MRILPRFTAKEPNPPSKSDFLESHFDKSGSPNMHTNWRSPCVHSPDHRRLDPPLRSTGRQEPGDSRRYRGSSHSKKNLDSGGRVYETTMRIRTDGDKAYRRDAIEKASRDLQGHR
ncbi:DUF7692 domain-containing protein [Haloarchaeobius salinus]|uniref:DUF7692 domain-containing protein n=1 Tax=Haloarchaeobius salinus TaxID=1198298 RepID=UPI003F604164